MDLFLKILIISKRGRDMMRTIRICNVYVSVCELNGGSIRVNIIISRGSLVKGHVFNL